MRQTRTGIHFWIRAIRRMGIIALSPSTPMYALNGHTRTSEAGAPGNALEDVAERFAYRQVQQRNSTCDGWGDLQAREHVEPFIESSLSQVGISSF